MNKLNRCDAWTFAPVRFSTTIAAGLLMAQLAGAQGTCNTACPPDLNFSGEVDGGDLGILLSDWNVVASCANFDNGSSGVDGGDLGVLLAAWGMCTDFGCPSAGDCCAVHVSSGCNDAACCDSVCFTDPDCCDTGWDQQCVDAANGVCDVCAPECPGTGDCCGTHPSPGCNDSTCCEAVCAAIPACCDTTWDQSCVDSADAQCIGCGEPCPGIGDCCAVHPFVGCSDSDCCDSVCFTILDCCDSAWDQACVNVANMVCRQCM